MIESIQNRDYMLMKLKNSLALKMFGVYYSQLNEHELNEIRIQLRRIIRNEQQIKNNIVSA